MEAADSIIMFINIYLHGVTSEFAGSNPAEAVEFFGHPKKSSVYLPSEGK
jgi:hypothetical protein